MLYALVFHTALLLPMPDWQTCEKVRAETIKAYQQQSFLDLVIACPDTSRFQCQRRA